MKTTISERVSTNMFSATDVIICGPDDEWEDGDGEEEIDEDGIPYL